MRRRSLLPLLVILMFLFPLLQAGNSPAKGLDGRQQSMVLVSAYTANGDLERLRPALGQALDAGLTINEIKEVLTHLWSLRRLSPQSERAAGLHGSPGAAPCPWHHGCGRKSRLSPALHPGPGCVRRPCPGRPCRTKGDPAPVRRPGFCPGHRYFFEGTSFCGHLRPRRTRPQSPRTVHHRRSGQPSRTGRPAAIPHGRGHELRPEPEELEGFLDLLAARVGRRADAAAPWPERCSPRADVPYPTTEEMPCP